MKFLAALLCGLIFGLGLIVSGMGDPAKVLNFLDVAGTFDPSLVFVMGGAIVVAFAFFQFSKHRRSPFFTSRFHWPSGTAIDRRLVGGATLFGAGWGLSGFCPGPAVISIPLAATGTLIFALAMLVGMTVARRI
jgi:uncharacterized protein